MHCALYKFVIFVIFVVEESIRNFNYDNYSNLFYDRATKWPNDRFGFNHREAVCYIKTSSCGTIEQIERIFPEPLKAFKSVKICAICGSKMVFCETLTEMEGHTEITEIHGILLI